MAKKVFLASQSVITADDMNRIETLRFDIFNEATDKDSARDAIGAAPISHGHSAATPSIGGLGGSNGFISATDLERLRKFSAYPSGTTPSPSGTFVVPMINDSGSIVFATISDLQTIFGSGGGGGSPPSEVDGGEAETTTFSSDFDGGESETTSFATDLDGGGA